MNFQSFQRFRDNQFINEKFDMGEYPLHPKQTFIEP